MRNTTKPTTDEDGTESHPAFGLISASRVSSNPGSTLFVRSCRAVVDGARRGFR